MRCLIIGLMALVVTACGGFSGSVHKEAPFRTACGPQDKDQQSTCHIFGPPKRVLPNVMRSIADADAPIANLNCDDTLCVLEVRRGYECRRLEEHERKMDGAALAYLKPYGTEVVRGEYQCWPRTTTKGNFRVACEDPRSKSDETICHLIGDRGAVLGKLDEFGVLYRNAPMLKISCEEGYGCIAEVRVDYSCALETRGTLGDGVRYLKREKGESLHGYIRCRKKMKHSCNFCEKQRQQKPKKKGMPGLGQEHLTQRG